MRLKLFSQQISINRLLLIIFTAVYSFAAMLLHVEFSKLATGKYPQFTGEFNAKAHSIEFSITFLLLVVSYLIWNFIKGERRLVTIYYWGLYSIVLFLFYLFISLHAVEIIHLIQYTTVAMLIGFCVDPKRDKFLIGKVLFIGISLGIIDELLQYYIISPGHKYLDFNDFFVNMMGTISGSLLFYGFRKPPATEESPICSIYCTHGFAYIIILTIIISALFITGHLQVSPPFNIKPGSYAVIDGQLTFFMERRPEFFDTWQKHFTRGHYYAFGPLTGMISIFIVAFVFATFDPRFINRFMIKRTK
jgi:hypothetical protein